MKVTRPAPQTPPFVPVHVILESQAELDELAAWANHRDINPEHGLLYGLEERLSQLSRNRQDHTEALNMRIRLPFAFPYRTQGGAVVEPPPWPSFLAKP